MLSHESSTFGCQHVWVVLAVVGIALIVLRRQGREVPIPFGPYLVVAGLIALFWGDSITRKYLDFL